MRQPRFPFVDLWGEMGRVHDELNRLFGRFNGANRLQPPLGPAVNIWEDEQNVYAEANLPGLKLDQIEILVNEGNQLTIQGARAQPSPEGAVLHRQERGFGQFLRQLELPALVDADRVEAKYEQGVLRLTMPKSEAAKPRRIDVKAS